MIKLHTFLIGLAFSVYVNATPPFSVTLQPGATKSLAINGVGAAHYIVSLNPAAPALNSLSVTEGIPAGVTQVTSSGTRCSVPIKVCHTTFGLNPGEQCCLSFSFKGSDMVLGNNSLQPVVAMGTYKVRPATPLNISVTPSVEYWVSPTAPANGTGQSADSPFPNLYKAQMAVRHNPLRGQYTIYINLLSGVYQGANNILKLTPQDSGSKIARVIYRAAPGARPIISGAQKISGWVLVDPTYNIWSASVTLNTPGIPRQLYVNGKRARRSRTPDYPNYYTPGATGYTYEYLIGSDPQFPPIWENPAAVEAVTQTQWKMMRCPVASISTNESGQSNVTMQTPCWTNANVFPEPWNFHLLSWLENAYEFLTSPYSHPGDWYLNPVSKKLYYIPLPGQDINTADVELPVTEQLIEAQGDETNPVTYLSFEGIKFIYATWYGPNSANGYVADQSGFLLVGSDHQPNLIGHDPDVVRTLGNLSFIYARNIIVKNNTIMHMGAAALDFSTGSQNNQIINNEISDISGAGIQLGGVRPEDHHPLHLSQKTQDNLIANNLVAYTGQDYSDSAGIFIGVTTRTTVEHNQISHVPWSGIAIGWGWGLFDPGNGFVGLPAAQPNQWAQPWGSYTTPSAALGNKIQFNVIDSFLEKLWDGGAIYSTGFQGTTLSNGQMFVGNVAKNKRPESGGNTYYTDGGSRYITLNTNVSLNNPQGTVDFGPCSKASSFAELCVSTGIVPYGTDMGGCIPYGNLLFENNYWGNILQFYTICTNPYFPNYPISMNFEKNVMVNSSADVPQSILNNAGRR